MLPKKIVHNGLTSWGKHREAALQTLQEWPDTLPASRKQRSSLFYRKGSYKEHKEPYTLMQTSCLCGLLFMSSVLPSEFSVWGIILYFIPSELQFTMGF